MNRAGAVDVQGRMCGTWRRWAPWAGAEVTEMKSGPIFSANPMEPIERMRERYACFQKCEDLLNRAESGKRKLTAAERAEYAESAG